ncbi:MAG: hypothetical protein PHW64_01820 [Sulfuricurvum sp.]|nr:hypothetical protein [Sulfuricurvum sp.]
MGVIVACSIGKNIADQGVQSRSFPKMHRPLVISFRIKKRRKIEAIAPLITPCNINPL